MGIQQCDQFLTAIDIQFLINIADMGFDRIQRNAQHVPDLLVIVSLDNERNDLFFAGRNIVAVKKCIPRQRGFRRLFSRRRLHVMIIPQELICRDQAETAIEDRIKSEQGHFAEEGVIDNSRKEYSQKNQEDAAESLSERLL